MHLSSHTARVGTWIAGALGLAILELGTLLHTSTAQFLNGHIMGLALIGGYIGALLIAPPIFSIMMMLRFGPLANIGPLIRKLMIFIGAGMVATVILYGFDSHATDTQVVWRTGLFAVLFANAALRRNTSDPYALRIAAALAGVIGAASVIVQGGPLWLGVALLPLGVFFFHDFWLHRGQSGGALDTGQSGINSYFNLWSSNDQRPRTYRPQRRFRDVVGMEPFKGRLLEAAQEILKGRSQRNGILLHGEPGNGKTLFAEALAGELGLPILQVALGQIESRWQGETTERLMAYFRAAQSSGRMVLFFDEIDALLIDRGKVMRAESENARLVTTFLTEIEKVRRTGRVVIIAATNYLDRLDPAGVREGRFDYKMEVPPPDQPAREAILRAGLGTAARGRFGRRQPALAIEPGVLASAARRCSGFSAARVRAIGEETARELSRAGATTVRLEDVLDGLRRLQGRRGTRLDENTPPLSAVVLRPQTARHLAQIAGRMRDPERTEALGGTVPSGLLFYGPPGTGKTLTAKALAKETGWACLTTNGQDLAQPGRIDGLLKEASELRPCIVFIDEADDILADRGDFRGRPDVLNALLGAMDGAGGKTPDLLFIAATNRPEAMDAAALRGGRFTEKLEFGLPGPEELTTYLQHWLQGSRARFAVAGEALTAHLGGLAFANVNAILQGAVNNMVGRTAGSDTGLVNLEDVLDAKQVILGTR